MAADGSLRREQQYLSPCRDPLVTAFQSSLKPLRKMHRDIPDRLAQRLFVRPAALKRSIV